jgi:hypothetical protein
MLPLRSIIPFHDQEVIDTNPYFVCGQMRANGVRCCVLPLTDQKGKRQDLTPFFPAGGSFTAIDNEVAGYLAELPLAPDP